MKTDRPIKVLFERLGQSLLPFIGERQTGVRVTAVESVSLPVSERRIDSVLRLERDGLVWYRHLEFQAQKDLDMPRRCFEYNSRLILHYGAAVLTTVLYLLPGADKDVPDAFRLYVGDWLAYEWRFDVVRLWEIDAESALGSGEAGPLALVPLMRGGDEPSRVLEAARRLDAMPKAQAADAMSVLLGFAARRYDRATFMNVLGKDRVMESWWDQLVDEREARGEARGQIKNARQMCSDLVKEFHPGTAAALLPAIEACDQPETLRSWALQCAKLPDEAFVTLVTGTPPARVARSRATRPSRRATRRSAADGSADPSSPDTAEAPRGDRAAGLGPRPLLADLRHSRAAGHPLALAGPGAARPVVVVAVVVPVVVGVVVRVLLDLGSVEHDAQDARAGVGDALEGVDDGLARHHLGAGDDDDSVGAGAPG